MNHKLDSHTHSAVVALVKNAIEFKMVIFFQDEIGNIPVEFLDLYNDEELKKTLIDLILTASDLDILEFQVNSYKLTL